MSIILDRIPNLSFGNIKAKQTKTFAPTFQAVPQADMFVKQTSDKTANPPIVDNIAFGGLIKSSKMAIIYRRNHELKAAKEKILDGNVEAAKQFMELASSLPEKDCELVRNDLIGQVKESKALSSRQRADVLIDLGVVKDLFLDTILAQQHASDIFDGAPKKRDNPSVAIVSVVGSLLYDAHQSDATKNVNDLGDLLKQSSDTHKQDAYRTLLKISKKLLGAEKLSGEDFAGRYMATTSLTVALKNLNNVRPMELKNLSKILRDNPAFVDSKISIMKSLPEIIDNIKDSISKLEENQDKAKEELASGLVDIATTLMFIYKTKEDTKLVDDISVRIKAVQVMPDIIKELCKAKGNKVNVEAVKNNFIAPMQQIVSNIPEDTTNRDLLLLRQQSVVASDKITKFVETL